ncbi:4-(cytidine 5'-diphospho)-2-C-methyl-D-erythritol kinase [Sphingomonas desiccabilis]|uniref:4-diphosphocytidyl-2-C-methyl-D-erythritol kinase n=1 Tax=Sphingomonas desiccabilis TaxID=429134 RepID=A0A4Q2IXM2_9SPHN|nr:4-(cytidine 5'-diphospho)-2-C-methyl-D-erythritol kinase [Sphingomonas desiccabilis]MBB3910620.1 4-diphosphocytidyl-2-C-methyl-D-erythritol kinase [Sphingomonas desiccabilis]RXZ35246.1 4-(cytidine 5'-diphospho)-2-C-methyl-D-erythritol kinase [Sphingomonas desiccabilis]
MIQEIARAKLNLALHVRHRRSDGYHALETLFAFVRDGDLLTLSDAETDRFAITGPFAATLQAESDNLVTRARDRFRLTFGDDRPCAILLDKRLPVASGIGGGSADAAAALRALATRAGVRHDDPDLLACANVLGSDVPACLLSRTAIGRGRGEDLVPVDGLGGVPALLVNPGVGVSTAAVFERWDGVDRGSIGSGDLLEVARSGRNDLEPPARSLAPAIDGVLAVLARQPRTHMVRMSGSGATCFALFEDAPACAAAAEAIRSAEPGWWCLETALI